MISFVSLILKQKLIIQEDGIVQVENFGIHLNVDGTVLYGMKIEAILDRTEESVSVDHLARLLVDVHQDSSQILNDLLSAYQRSLLDMLFMGDGDQGKFNMLISEGINHSNLLRNIWIVRTRKNG